MFLIKKLSQRYDPAEDRLQFAIENDSAEVIVLWVTQRISMRLLNALNERFKFISADIFDKSNQQASKSIKSDHELKKTPHSQALEEAVAGAKSIKEQEQPVIFAESKEFGLVHGINFSFKENKIEVLFKWGVTGSALLILDQNQLKVFWNGVLRLFSIAKWPKPIFIESNLDAKKNITSDADDFDEPFDAVITSKLMH